MHHFFPVRTVTFQEFTLVPEAFLQLLLARIKVSFFHSRKYLPANPNNTSITPTEGKIKNSKLIANTINGLSTRTPFSSTCLVKVLAAHSMLSKRSIPHCLHFGINKKSSKGVGLNAHAWLSVSSEIIIGGSSCDNFKEISRYLF